jgi:hypothetical protein
MLDNFWDRVKNAWFASLEWFEPADGCVYCWVTRGMMIAAVAGFVLGAVCL